MKIKRQGFLQAFGIVIYCSLMSVFFWQGQSVFPRVNQYLAPVIMLILFIVSALICGIIVFKKPYELFFDGKKKEAVNLIIQTALWLFLFLFAFFLSVILTNK